MTRTLHRKAFHSKFSANSSGLRTLHQLRRPATPEQSRRHCARYTTEKPSKRYRLCRRCKRPRGAGDIFHARRREHMLLPYLSTGRRRLARAFSIATSARTFASAGYYVQRAGLVASRAESAFVHVILALSSALPLFLFFFFVRVWARAQVA